jgi:DNA repair protein RadC
MENDVHDFGQARAIKQWALADRPREKFIALGRETLSDAELLAILLGHGYKAVSAVELARRLLQRFDNDLGKLARCNLQEIIQVKGIGVAKGLTIAAAMELGRRRKNVQQETRTYKDSASIYNDFRHLFEDLLHEEFRILLLTRSLRLIAEKRISIGGINNTIADPKKILREMILYQASLVVLMHNHPSGNLVPSEPDRDITRRLSYLAKQLDSKIADHLIFTNDGYYSFSDEGEQSLLAA